MSQPKKEIPLVRSFVSFCRQGSEEEKKIGEEALKRSALLVLAGGSGSRLRFSKPKGCFPISNVKEKSLFELLADKVQAASKLSETPLEMAIMTSPVNEEETKNFFAEHHYFGLKQTQVHFFSQELWPLLDFEGNTFYEEKEKLAFGPNGNGYALHSLYKSPIYKRWKEQKIEIINVVPIDNPLANPFDAALLGHHVHKQNEITIKAVNRLHPKEKVGVIVEGAKVIEYGEAKLLDEEKAVAYIGLFCLNLSYLEKIKDVDLPVHKAKKSVKMMNQYGETVFPKEPNAWKFESFLFDTFEYSDKVGVLLYPRSECFAPLKNFEGEDSILTVKKALLEADRQMYQQISGIELSSNVCFELSSDFYFLTSDLKKAWKGRNLPQTPYVEVK